MGPERKGDDMLFRHERSGNESQAFTTVFLSVLALSLVSLAVCIGLAIWGSEGELARNLFETCETTWKMGFGAILGLLAGKATLKAPDAE